MQTFLRVALGAMFLLAACDLIRAQEQPPTAPPVSHIVAVIKYCKVEFPTECRELEIVPDEGREPASQIECMRGLMMNRAEFTFEGERWFTKGGTCKELHNDTGTWLEAKKGKIKP